MKFLAHITSSNGQRIEQTLWAHCRKTAYYAGEAMRHLDLYNTGYLAGLLHDMGKATNKFNQYLEDSFAEKPVKRGSVNHTFAAVIYLLEHFHHRKKPEEDLTAEIISYAVGAHHGLFDCTDLEGNSGFGHRLHKDRIEICYEEAVQNYFEHVATEEEVSSLFFKASAEIKSFVDKLLIKYNGKYSRVFFQISLTTRMLLSAVIYGDRRDTGEFMKQLEYKTEYSFDWNQTFDYFEAKIQAFDSSSAINQVRRHISEQCLSFSSQKAGIFRLNVPTGGGKTLCSLRYGLAHAKQYKKRRIIFIIPLLSVLEQNAAVIHQYLPDENIILEHHSNVVREKSQKNELDYYELSTEDWEKPVIISTLVQLLNILFSGKTSDIKRMQALCNSIIIIDEIQSIPKKLISMFNMAMNFLQECCNTTIVLSSATQPCFDNTDWPLHLASQADMVVLSEAERTVFKRNHLKNCTTPYGMSLEECSCFCHELIRKHISLLIICNTKKEAGDLYSLLNELDTEKELDIFHLSTSMCPQHRIETLKQITNQLSVLQAESTKQLTVKKLICVSTQLVEAGIDFSFDGVVRILAGMDNLAQSAGRCNRSNEYGYPGTVYLINLKNESLQMLPDIRHAQDCTRKILALSKNQEIDVGNEDSIRQYYSFFFEEIKKEIDYPLPDYKGSITLTSLLANDNPFQNRKRKNYQMNQPFQQISRYFHVFENDTIDIIVPYGKGKQLIRELENMKQDYYALFSVSQVLENAKPFTISVFRYQYEQLYNAGLLTPLFEGRISVLDEKAYDPFLGVSVPEELTPEDYIF